MVQSPTTRLGLLAALAVVATGCSLVFAVDKEDCPEDFECVLVEAPLDHDNPDGDTIEVVFALRPADGERAGVLVTAVGGPGASGLESAEYEPDAMDPEILEHFDLVYFDQRGLRSFPEPACPVADGEFADAYYELPFEDPLRWVGLVELNEEYNQSCLEEIGASDVIPHLGTDQVAADLEMFRRRQSYDKIIIYGQSYGTAVAQKYAALYPHRVERLILDGPLDLSRDSLEQTEDQIAGLTAVTDLMFLACDSDSACSADMGRPAGEVYRSVIAELLEQPRIVRFPIASDKYEDQSLTAEDITYLAFANSYFEGDRMLYLRSLASAERGDYVPMLRLYSASGFGLSSIVNQGVSCLDGSIPGNDAQSELVAVSDGRAAVRPELAWFYEFPLSCVHWPGVDRTAGPMGGFPGAAIPTLIVAAEADAATPSHRALEMLDQFEDPRLLQVMGGSHVMFGRGIACVDEHVTTFILVGDAPPEADCEAPVVEPYVPLISVESDLDELLTAVDNELFYLPELLYWDGYSIFDVPCTHGGAVTFTGTDLTTDYQLDGCGFTPELVLDGEGEWDYEHGRSDLTATIEGDTCRYEFRQIWGETLGSAEAICP